MEELSPASSTSHMLFSSSLLLTIEQLQLQHPHPSLQHCEPLSYLSLLSPHLSPGLAEEEQSKVPTEQHLKICFFSGL